MCILGKVTEDYCKSFTLLRVALFKICCISLGVLIGMMMPKKWQKTIAIISATLFTVSYIPLMMGLIKTWVQRNEKD